MWPDDGMVTVGGIRYRAEDAIEAGLWQPPGKHAAPENDGGTSGPETAVAPAPENKDATPPPGGRRRPTAKE